MAEFGIPTTLTTPLGSLVFNDYNSSSHLRLTARDGADAPALRTHAEALPSLDISQINDAYDDTLYEALRGEIVAPNPAARHVLEDLLRKHLRAIRRANGTLSWLPSGLAERRQRTVRYSERLTITGGYRKDFTFGLVAADPLAYSETLHDLTSGVYDASSQMFGPPPTLWYFNTAAGSNLSVLNAGDEASFPLVRIYGPATNPVITNVTTGEAVALTNLGGLTIPNGQWVDVTMRQQGVFISVPPWSKIQHVDAATSEFWSLAPGLNSINLFVGSGSGGNTRMQILWRDAWGG